MCVCVSVCVCVCVCRLPLLRSFLSSFRERLCWACFWFVSSQNNDYFSIHITYPSPLNAMPSKYLVEIGRVALVDFGENAGKLVTIVDVIDQNRALVDGTPAGVPRQAIQFKRLRLTKFKLPIPHGTSSKVVKKAYAAAEIDAKFAETPVAKRLVQRQLKSAMNDFDRFKLYKAKQQYNRIVSRRFALLKFKSKAAEKAKK